MTIQGSSTWNKDVFIALAAIAWADGALDPDEADAIVRAAVDLGVELEDIASIEEATRAKVDLGAVDRVALTKDDRVFVYAVACWIARLDGVVTEEESVALAESRREARRAGARPGAGREDGARGRRSCPKAIVRRVTISAKLRALLTVKAVTGRASCEASPNLLLARAALRANHANLPTSHSMPSHDRSDTTRPTSMPAQPGARAERDSRASSRSATRSCASSGAAGWASSTCAATSSPASASR